MLDLSSLLLFSENPQQLADFYKKVFQKEPDWAEHGYYGFSVGKTFLSIGPHEKIKGKNTTPERMIFNLSTDDVKEQFGRIKGIGAVVIAEPYKPEEVSDMWIATFEDPDGNYFQLTTPWEGK